MTTITDAQVVAALQAWYRTEPAMSQWMPVVKDRMRRSLEAAAFVTYPNQVIVSHIDECSFTLPPKLSPGQQTVLLQLFDSYDPGYYAYYTRSVATHAGLTEPYARKALRALVRKGLAELVRGLQSEEDGHLMGSGYRLTDAGRKFAEGMGE